MNTNLQSKNISLLFDYRVDEYGDLMADLWKTLRRSAVQAGQVSSPDLASFADECLFCAQIVTNVYVSSDKGEDTQPADTPDSLWDRHLPSTSQPERPIGQRIGLIYLHAGPANVPAGEAEIGVVITPNMQRRGYAREAVELVLRWAFEELQFHRVQASILETQFRDRAMRLFIGAGFSHEGTKRRAVYQPEGEGISGMWKDVTYLAMLDTEWVLKSSWRKDVTENAVITVWDEMFARHAREREELVKWEEKHGRVRKSSSTETLREGDGRSRNTEDIAYSTDDGASSFGNCSAYGSSPGPNIFITTTIFNQDQVMADDPSDSNDANLDQRWLEVERALHSRRHRQDAITSLLEPSTSGHLLALPSIPSHLSDANPHSPLTIPSPVSIPPPPPSLSPSPSPAPSSSHDSWSDSGSENNWQLGNAPVDLTVPIAIPYIPTSRPRGSASLRVGRSRSGSSGSSSASTVDSWSDAQSSVDTGSNGWDVISSASSASLRGYL